MTRASKIKPPLGSCAMGKSAFFITCVPISAPAPKNSRRPEISSSIRI